MARDFVTFVLNGEVETVRDIAPTTTLLQYLRRTKRLTGTKEGCAEGDCGACTVAVGERDGEDVRYRAVNACIQFVPMLEGKAVVTVEGIGTLADPHPVQQAMVEQHGSQCGFCTPGFVMSLYTAHAETDQRSTDDILAGNLCRCTGYGPIVAAAKAARALPAPAADLARRDREMRLLKDIAHRETVEVSHAGERLFSPGDADSLASLSEANPDATIIAGATDVGLWVTKQHRPMPKMIHLGRVRDLDFARLDTVDGKPVLRIGAAASYSTAEALVAEAYPDFGELLRRLGSVQVRNAGTLCGNIANGSPIGDTPPALIALGAVLVLRKGPERRRMPLEDFFIAYGKQDRRPGEFVEEVVVPLLVQPRDFRCYKIAKRFDQDISAVCGAFNIAIENGVVGSARIAFGGMAATPKRAKAVEAALAGKAWTEATVQVALLAFGTDFQPISDMRASANYRLLAAQNLLRRYFHETAHPLNETRIAGHGAVTS